jgi:hypothetical protein
VRIDFEYSMLRWTGEPVPVPYFFNTRYLTSSQCCGADATSFLVLEPESHQNVPVPHQVPVLNFALINQRKMVRAEPHHLSFLEPVPGPYPNDSAPQQCS